MIVRLVNCCDGRGGVKRVILGGVIYFEQTCEEEAGETETACYQEEDNKEAGEVC